MSAKVTKKQQAEQEREQAAAQLREMFPVGSTVHVVIRHVSSSGMSRAISVLHTDPKTGEIADVSYLVARAVEGFKLHPQHAGLRVGGTGMDMGFHVVYTLSRVIYRDGFACIGEGTGWADRCPANDHTNERERDYTPGRVHSDPGYALRHRQV